MFSVMVRSGIAFVHLFSLHSFYFLPLHIFMNFSNNNKRNRFPSKSNYSAYFHIFLSFQTSHFWTISPSDPYRVSHQNQLLHVPPSSDVISPSFPCSNLISAKAELLQRPSQGLSYTQIKGKKKGKKGEAPHWHSRVAMLMSSLRLCASTL